ncbi:hypothetical protein CFOL_v3_14625 [Cephalotus follicularis]|uniref:PMD domain-containing protein n=1 Tax=Cephalotus follicularis TaxID=3775 RepID=A0A1Q3BT27_CEPFO|nr:hypothetical protein CFOL_v3_14625 [Cephalotus follicularis]
MSLFLLAITIVKGGRFPLAPLFMGSLYKHLDLYKGSMEASLGHNLVLCFGDTVALQLFLYAPEVVIGKAMFKAWLRYTLKAQDNLLDFLDDEVEFNFGPYAQDDSSNDHIRLYTSELVSHPFPTTTNILPRTDMTFHMTTSFRKSPYGFYKTHFKLELFLKP